MKRRTFLFILITISFLATAQTKNLRGVIAVVRPVYGEETINFLDNFANRLAKEGYDSLAVELRRYSKGSGFGSGFVYRCPNDTNFYLVTNRHVVAQAKSAVVEFISDSQNQITYQNCNIVSVDYNKDLALIALPSSAKFENILPFSTRLVNDADDVFSAGYPGLAGKPSWQIGKGIVSNSNLLIDQGINKNISVIQHTAQINPGSSGGPLLLKNANNESGFEIVGVNTWKMTNRESTNFAIPLKTVNEFLDNSFARKNESKDMLKDRAEDFLTARKSVLKIVPFIADEYISKLSIDEFYLYLKKVPKDVRSYIMDLMDDGSPIEAIRTIIAYKMAEVISSQRWSLENVEEFNADKSCIVNFLVEGNVLSTTWVLNHGEWKLIDIPTINFRKEPASSMFTDKNFLYNFRVSYAEKITGKDNTRVHEFMSTKSLSPYIITGSSFLYLKNDIHEAASVNGQLGLQLPLKLGILDVVPVVKGFAGPAIDDGFEFNYGYSAGVEFAFRQSNKYYYSSGDYYVLGLCYRNVEFETWNTSLLQFYVGFSF